MTGLLIRLGAALLAVEIPRLQRRAVEAAPTPARRWTAPSP
jgi:hypothetical protein